ncbi:hypothetical protein [Nocardioides sp. NPDC006273]|uniref:hypothetical protein n=1 Tax=Nocardioides sp. NPDC006273 TaxID=3155598 RepID=UPI0033B344EE
MRFASAVLIAAVAVAGLVLSDQFRSGVPVVDDFYDAPAGVPAEAGRLVRSEPYAGDLPAGLKAYRILYTTTATDGSPAMASRGAGRARPAVRHLRSRADPSRRVGPRHGRRRPSMHP